MLCALCLLYATLSLDPFRDALFYGVLFAAPFFLLWWFSGGSGMGIGDGLVALPLGLLFTRFDEVISAFVFSFWIGTFFVGMRMLVRAYKKKKPFKPKERIAFLPFLCLGVGSVVLGGASLQGLYTLVFG